MAERVGFLLPRRSRFSAEAGHPHWRSLSSLFFHWKHSGWLRIPRSFLFVSFLTIYDIRNTIYDSWRTRLQPIRTSAEITAHIKILPVHQPYLYQKLSQKATQLRLLGMSYQEIAKSLNITKKTAIRACKYGRR